MKIIPYEIVDYTQKYHHELNDHRLNHPGPDAWRTDDFSKNIVEEINNNFGKQDFRIWKNHLRDLMNEFNNNYCPDWNYDLYLSEVSGYHRRNTSTKQYIQSNNSEKILETYRIERILSKLKLIFDIFFPNSKIYVVTFGNTLIKTKYFNKGQKVRYYQWGNNCGYRGGWLGFNRKTKQYELHNIRYKYIHNVRLKMVGHVDIYDGFTYL